MHPVYFVHYYWLIRSGKHFFTHYKIIARQSIFAFVIASEASGALETRKRKDRNHEPLAVHMLIAN